MSRIAVLVLALVSLFLWLQSESGSDGAWVPLNGEPVPLREGGDSPEDLPRDGPARTTRTSDLPRPAKMVNSAPMEATLFAPNQRWATGHLFLSESKALVLATLRMEVRVSRESEDSYRPFLSYLSTLPDSVESRHFIFRLSPTSFHGAYDARVSFSKEPSNDDVDVGDVLLDSLPLLVDGTIADVNGLEVPSAQIRAQLKLTGTTLDLLGVMDPTRCRVRVFCSFWREQTFCSLRDHRR